MNTKVSIIVPVYGVERYVEQCVKSIISQTYKNLEIIFIDDGSKDRSGEILDKYVAIDNRCRIIHKQNEGYGVSCNLGIKIATGDFLTIVEPDDYLKSTFIEDLLKTALEFGADIVKCGYNEDIISKNKIQEVSYSDIPSRVILTDEQRAVFLRFHPSIWTCLYNTIFIKNNNISFQEIAGSAWVDNLFQVKTISLCKTMVFLNKNLYNYRVSTGEPADDLNNWRWPFDRSCEINCWIDDNKINYFIKKNIYQREVSYIKIAMKAKCDDERLLIKMAGELARYLIKENINHKILSDKDVVYLNKIIDNGWIERKWRIFKKTTNHYFKVHLTKREKTVIVFGLKLL